MKVLFTVLVLLLVSCNHPPKNIEDIICQNFKKENFKTSLVLFFAENMCSECISVELQNLSKCNIKQIVIAGAFSNKRIFYSSLSSYKTDSIAKIFIEEKLPSAPSAPFYLVYDEKSSKFSNFFVPAPCAKEKTFEYYLKVENLLTPSPK